MNMVLSVITKDAPMAATRVAQGSGLPQRRVIVVSNHSCQEANEKLRQALPGAHHLHLNRPHSIAFCLNAGIRMPAEAGWPERPEWTVLANDDVEFDGDWVGKLEACLAENPRALQVNLAYPRNRYSCIAIHRDLVRKIGWWDERFTGMFYEDEDWHLRLSEHAGVNATRLHERGGRRDMIIAIIDAVRHDGRLRAEDVATYGRRCDLSAEANRAFFLKKWRRAEQGGWASKGKVDGHYGNFVRVLPEADPYPRELLAC